MSLFEMERICPKCNGTGKVWNDKVGAMVACRNKEFHANANEVQVAANAPETSVLAAERAMPGSGSMRARILGFIVDRGLTGATDEEIEKSLGLRHQSASARRNELARDGWIKDSGERRKTSSGSEATVWVFRETTL